MLLAVVLCFSICACGNNGQKKIEKQLMGTWSALSEQVATDGTEHYIDWTYIFYKNGDVDAIMSIVIPFADTTPRGTAKGTFEIKEDAIQIIWNEVDNESMTTIWEVGGTENLLYTFEDDVLFLYGPDLSLLEHY